MALLSLQASMCSPEPMYNTDRNEYEETARFWTDLYAKPTRKEDAISGVCEMGFDRAQAKKALEKHSWDESAAVNELLGGI
jgi:ubiquitin-conjugating enzyme (huntingtin interacting protein 2)